MIDGAEVRKAIGVNVRRLRKAKKLTQEQLAEKVGISPVHMNRIEQGHSSPSAEVLFAISDELGVEADKLRQVPVSTA